MNFLSNCEVFISWEKNHKKTHTHTYHTGKTAKIGKTAIIHGIDRDGMYCMRLFVYLNIFD